MIEITTRARRDRLAQIKEDLSRVDRAAARALYDWGVNFAEVARDELWKEDGAASFTEWIEDHTPYSARHARRAIEIARHFTPDMCERFGSTKLNAALRVLELTAREEQPGDLTALVIRVRDGKGHYSSKPFAKATVAEIQAYCTELQAGARSRREGARVAEIDGSVRERAVSLQKVLPAAPRGTSKGDRVVVQKGRDGQLALTFKAIPVGELRAFVEALHQHLLDESEPR